MKINKSNPELTATLLLSRTSLFSLALFTAVINTLMLAGAFYMLQVYDRVLPSQSVATLIALSVIIVAVFGILAMMDIIRGRLFARIGASFEQRLQSRIYRLITGTANGTNPSSEGLKPLRDMDTVRHFISGGSLASFFDLPFVPIYLMVIYLLHPWLGLVALCGAVFLVGITALAEILSKTPSLEVKQYGSERLMQAEAGRRNAEVLSAMGMADRLCRRWIKTNSEFIESNLRVSDLSGDLGAIARVFRMLIQSCLLGTGAYLVILGEATAGVIIAGSILGSRALAPIGGVISNWKSFVAARQSWRALDHLLRSHPERPAPVPLPAPVAQLTVEKLTIMLPGGQRPAVQNVGFSVDAGHALGIIGPSASGKSSLARLLAGAWQPTHGRVCLDGAALNQWSNEALGHHIGYMPQDVELFAGTVAQNIARFDADADPAEIVRAAREAGTHHLITALPDGYETEIGEQGRVLSAGQRQRVALARAFYGKPFLVILDEPNSNLDAEGETALIEAILRVRSRKGIVVMIAHRPAVLRAVDQGLVMRNGMVGDFGSREDVISRLQSNSISQAEKPVLQVVGAGA